MVLHTDERTIRNCSSLHSRPRLPAGGRIIKSSALDDNIAEIWRLFRVLTSKQNNSANRERQHNNDAFVPLSALPSVMVRYNTVGNDRQLTAIKPSLLCSFRWSKQYYVKRAINNYYSIWRAAYSGRRIPHDAHTPIMACDVLQPLQDHQG